MDNGDEELGRLRSRRGGRHGGGGAAVCGSLMKSCGTLNLWDISRGNWKVGVPRSELG